MNLVHIPFHDWKKSEREGFRTRDGHFMQEFGEHREVEKLLIINRPISISEMLLLRRNWGPQQGETVFRDGDVYLNKVGSTTYTLDIRIREFIKPLQMKRNWTSYIFGHQKVAVGVQRALTELQMDSEFALFLSAPLYAPLVPHLSPRVIGFDAQDNLLKHAFYQDVPGLAAHYDFLLERADFIWANSPETTAWFKTKRSDARYISNGVDTNVFSPARSYEVPSDVEPIAGPIVGYAGKMQEMFDVDLMCQVVQQLPDVNFIFIGQELNSNWVKPLWQFPNTHYLGDKPYTQLPSYLAAFDVCIIPYNQQRQHGVDPIKFYEYLAMGKPVVTTNIGGVSAFQEYPQVRIADSAEEFLGSVAYFTDAIRQGRAPAITQLPEKYTWAYKANEIVQSLLLKQAA